MFTAGLSASAEAIRGQTALGSFLRCVLLITPSSPLLLQRRHPQMTLVVPVSDGRDRAVSKPRPLGAAVDTRGVGASVIHWARGVRSGIRQGESSPGDLVQGHEEDAKPRVLRAVVQQA